LSPLVYDQDLADIGVAAAAVHPPGPPGVVPGRGAVGPVSPKRELQAISCFFAVQKRSFFIFIFIFTRPYNPLTPQLCAAPRRCHTGSGALLTVVALFLTSHGSHRRPFQASFLTCVPVQASFLTCVPRARRASVSSALPSAASALYCSSSPPPSAASFRASSAPSHQSSWTLSTTRALCGDGFHNVCLDVSFGRSLCC
jgi:hypothetical protein